MQLPGWQSKAGAGELGKVRASAAEPLAFTTHPMCVCVYVCAGYVLATLFTSMLSPILHQLPKTALAPMQRAISQTDCSLRLRQWTLAHPP